MKPHERIIVALDVSDIDSVINLVRELLPHVGCFKVGLEMIYSTMAELLLFSEMNAAFNYFCKVRKLAFAIGKKAFLDVKLNDIPNTVDKASKAISCLKPTMFNIHASAGEESIIKAVANKGCSQIFGVTVLTSLQCEECKSIFGSTPNRKVLQFADMLVDLGVDGIICAPQEGQMLRKHSEFNGLVIACPNVRPWWAYDKDNQNKERQVSLYDAILSGIDVLIMGRAITNPPPEIGGPIEAAKKIAEDISLALKDKK